MAYLNTGFVAVSNLNGDCKRLISNAMQKKAFRANLNCHKKAAKLISISKFPLKFCIKHWRTAYNVVILMPLFSFYHCFAFQRRFISFGCVAMLKVCLCDKTKHIHVKPCHDWTRTHTLSSSFVCSIYSIWSGVWIHCEIHNHISLSNICCVSHSQPLFIVEF